LGVRLQVGQMVRKPQVNVQEGKFESWVSPIKTNKKNEQALLLYSITANKSKLWGYLLKNKIGESGI
jgi:FtsZ-interacting cell division protein ZipA